MVTQQEGDTPEEQVEREESHAALWDAIDRLPEDRRNLLLYKFGSRLSNLEIGELLQKSESSIKSLYFRTLATLRKELETAGWGTAGWGMTGRAAPDASEQTHGEEEL